MIWIGLKGLLRLEREILILIHQYINNGYHIVLDVNSGSVHVVDPVVYDAIAAVSALKLQYEGDDLVLAVLNGERIV